MKEEEKNTSTGFFAAVGDEEIQKITKERCINCGRGGVYIKKKDLIQTLQSNEEHLDVSKIAIVEIFVPNGLIIGKTDKRFRIKGKNVLPIEDILSFEKIKAQTMAVA